MAWDAERDGDGVLNFDELSWVLRFNRECNLLDLGREDVSVRGETGGNEVDFGGTVSIGDGVPEEIP